MENYVVEVLEKFEVEILEFGGIFLEGFYFVWNVGIRIICRRG